MLVKNVQELEDKTITFEGELGPSEAAVVLSFGLNALFSMGLMSMIPDISVSEFATPDPDNIQ